MPINLNNGLVAYYPFDGNANDLSGNENNGVEYGGVSYSDGVIGGAIKFGGINNPAHIKILNNNTLQFTTQLTISTWINIPEYGVMDGFGDYVYTTGGGAIFAKDHDTTGFYAFAGMDDGGIFSASMNAKPMYDNFSSGALLEGQELGFWEHVVFVFENKIASMYINGIKVFEKTYGENVDFSLSNQNDLYIGKFSEYWYPFNGYMDNFRIYNRALNDSEIQSLYNQRK